jgi:V8-like Glu-specific endopeptidase
MGTSRKSQFIENGDMGVRDPFSDLGGQGATAPSQFLPSESDGLFPAASNAASDETLPELEIPPICDQSIPASPSAMSHGRDFDGTEFDDGKEFVIGEEDRRPVVGHQLASRPYDAICRITSIFNGRRFVGSGVLFRPNVVVTCGHNLLNLQPGGGFASQITVDFGVGTSSAISIAGSTLGVSDAYRSRRDFPEHDYGAILLQRSISTIRPLVFSKISDVSTYQSISSDIEVPGFPIIGRTMPTTMYTSRSRIVNLSRLDSQGNSTARSVIHHVDATVGQSGAPIIGWFPVSGGRRAPGVIGIHNKERMDQGHPNNYGAFLGDQMAHDLQRWT